MAEAQAGLGDITVHLPGKLTLQQRSHLALELSSHLKHQTSSFPLGEKNVCYNAGWADLIASHSYSDLEGLIASQGGFSHGNYFKKIVAAQIGNQMPCYSCLYFCAGVPALPGTQQGLLGSVGFVFLLYFLKMLSINI